MSSFFPETTIYLCATGIDDNNKYYADSNTAMASFCRGQMIQSFSQYSYQRADERQYCAVHANYNDICGADTIIWQNADFGSRWFIGNITELEWKNPNTVWVWFKLDAYSTYCGEVEWLPCFVERHHVSGDWSGGSPNFTNCGVYENLGTQPSRFMGNTVDRTFTPNRYVVVAPYDANGKPSITTTTTNGICSGLNQHVFSSTSEVDAFLNAVEDIAAADISIFVCFISVPSQFIEGTQTTITAPTAPWNSYGNIYNAKCFNSECCVLAICSLVSNSPKYYAPELFDDNAAGSGAAFIEKFTLVGGVGGLSVTPYSYGGILASASAPPNSFVIEELPEGSCTGDAYANWKTSHALNTIGSVLVSTGIGAITGFIQGSGAGGLGAAVGTAAGAITGLASAVPSAASTFASAKQASVQAVGTANANAVVACAIDGYGYYMGWKIITQAELYALDSYFSRFGYLVNELTTPNVNTRPYWNYVKTSEAHVGGNIPYVYRKDIEAMLNNGVTFWHTVNIGDFSNVAGNSNR